MEPNPQPHSAIGSIAIGTRSTNYPLPDAAEIIATFADVETDYWAPVTDEVISRCVYREWGLFNVMLVPPDFAPLQAIDSCKLDGVLSKARRGEVLLFAISRPAEGGLFGIMTVPRPHEPWIGLRLTDEEWCTQGDRPPYTFGIDQNAACELRFFCIQWLVRRLVPIVARPRPLIAPDELELRYAAILADAHEPLTIKGVDVSTWPRFLDRARSAVQMFGRKVSGVGEHADSAQRRVHELALEAWPPRIREV